MLLLPAAVTSDELIRFALSADAHRCCESTNGACAQLSTPDECCHTQEQAIGQGYTTIGPSSRLQLIPNLTLGLPAEFVSLGVELSAITNDAVLAFKRPHDPPHLHHFPLLI